MGRSSTTVRLALPSKGRMEEETIQMLADCGLRVNKTNPRQYSAHIPSMPDVLVLFQRARDVARSISTGDIDLGITGYDTVIDGLNGDLSRIVVIHDELGYGECELVVAVPEAWDTVRDVASLDAYAQSVGGLRVATKHTNAVEQFFRAHGATHLRLVSADGALEAAPEIGYADMIADITSTGTTLRDNHLKPLDDGTILRSEAVFIGNREALAERDDVLAVARQLLEFFEAHLRAQAEYLVIANMRGATGEEVAAQLFAQPSLSGLQGPTIAPVYTRENGSAGWWSVSMVVPAGDLYPAINQLRAIGGSGVIVTPAIYIFEERPLRYQRLLETLGKAEDEKVNS
ncbi:MAG: ATP phosphoribosyltransferase [Anaerolineae bacterium]|nr:ATP phosphoribosyltransferase [Anaerolineae bacterium]